VVFAALVGAGVSFGLTPLVRLIALRTGAVAHPGGRRVHVRPTPLLGGVAIYAGFVVAVVLTVALAPDLKVSRQLLGLLLGGSLVAFVGILDDKLDLPGWAQAAAILVGGLVLVLFRSEIRYVTNPFKHGELIWLGALSVPVTLGWVLMVTKAVDCMDGLDGLAAGIGVIAAGTLMLTAVRLGGKFQMSAVMAAALMGAALGFLRFNYPPAKIFMGTVGAQFLGFVLAGISMAGAFKLTTLAAIAAPILILGVPLFDTTFVVLKRAIGGKKVHEADTTHLHHRLVDKGLSHRQTIWFIYALTFIFCGAAYALFSYVK